MHLICDPRQLFFQCGAEMPKGWTPLALARNALSKNKIKTENLLLFSSSMCSF